MNLRACIASLSVMSGLPSWPAMKERTSVTGESHELERARSCEGHHAHVATLRNAGCHVLRATYTLELQAPLQLI